MKPFIFPLARIRRYKTQLLDKEKATLARLRKNKDEIATHIASLEAFRRDESQKFTEKQQQGITAQEISSHHFYMSNTRHQLEELAVLLEKAKEEVARQLKIVIALSQEISGLDKLEEKQLTEYRLEEARQNELQTSEHLSTALSRQKQAR